ncbi:nucleoside deaminase [Pedobacter panaciterrae]|jgi:Cytosine/adenosine deaminases|uniref:Nucleoside deaminase n=1 Tax=Pedobacter panaciterrae TaxID=363849 RepID=A0ABU8NRT0_9SPHI|nr:nucleoside deaminase [Pedobacter panaciterrae]NQX54338.1 nucleoside deaminase [Pedobacter panaciterrae]
MDKLKEHEKFMKLAIQLSEENVLEKMGGPFGAVVVKNGKVIAKSANMVTASNDPTAHAEVAAIRLACKKLKTFDLSGCVIYTSCEPCPMCLSAVYWARIDTIYYANTKIDAADIGFSDKFIYDEIHKSMADRVLPFKQMLRDEAQRAFKLWSKTAEKTEY